MPEAVRGEAKADELSRRGLTKQVPMPGLSERAKCDKKR